MQVIPTQAIPNQGIQCTLAGQQVSLSIYQTDYGLYLDLISNGAPIVYGVLCHDVDRIVRDAYLGFTGDLAWYDSTGNGEDPVFTGVGSQFLLLYLEASDL
jgi:hypothetical protein